MKKGLFFTLALSLIAFEVLTLATLVVNDELIYYDVNEIAWLDRTTDGYDNIEYVAQQIFNRTSSVVVVKDGLNFSFHENISTRPAGGGKDDLALSFNEYEKFLETYELKNVTMDLTSMSVLPKFTIHPYNVTYIRVGNSADAYEIVMEDPDDQVETWWIWFEFVGINVSDTSGWNGLKTDNANKYVSVIADGDDDYMFNTYTEINTEYPEKNNQNEVEIDRSTVGGAGSNTDIRFYSEAKSPVYDGGLHIYKIPADPGNGIYTVVHVTVTMREQLEAELGAGVLARVHESDAITEGGLNLL